MKFFDLIIDIDEKDKDCAEIMVNSHIDGSEFKMLLDTGSTKSILFYNDITQDYVSLGKHKMGGLMGAFECDLIQTKKICLGDLKITNLEICRMPVDGPKRSQIGMDFLNNQSLLFDFKENKVFLDQKSFVSNTEDLILDSKRLPYVDLNLGKGFWDTGAGITVVDQGFYKKNQNYFEQIGFLGVEDTTETEEQEMPLFLFKGLKAQNFLFPDHKVVIADLSPISQKVDKNIDFVLGYTTLSLTNWYIDFKNKKWAVIN